MWVWITKPAAALPACMEALGRRPPRERDGDAAFFAAAVRRRAAAATSGSWISVRVVVLSSS